MDNGQNQPQQAAPAPQPQQPPQPATQLSPPSQPEQDAYHQWLQQQVQAQGHPNQPPAPTVKSDPSAYQQHLEELEQQADDNQPVFSQPWLPPEQQVAKQAEVQNQVDYQPQQLAQQPEPPPPPPEPVMQPQPQLPQTPQPSQAEQLPPSQPQTPPPPVQLEPPLTQPEPQPQPQVVIGPHATIDHSHDADVPPQDSWRVTRTIGSGPENPEVITQPPRKKSHKKLTVFMSTLVFAAIGAAVILVFSLISQAGAKTLSCSIDGQNGDILDLNGYQLDVSVRLVSDNFSDITTNELLTFRNNIDAQNYINSGGDERVSNIMVANADEYIKSKSGAVIDGNEIRYSIVYKSDYIYLLAGAKKDTYHGTSEQLFDSAKRSLESSGYTCS
jgi:hypothetical protein